MANVVKDAADAPDCQGQGLREKWYYCDSTCVTQCRLLNWLEDPILRFRQTPKNHSGAGVYRCEYHSLFYLTIFLLHRNAVLCHTGYSVKESWNMAMCGVSEDWQDHVRENDKN